MNPPTTKQLAIWSFMIDYQAEHSRPPTIREIGDAFGIRSSNAVTDHLIALRKKGLVRHEPMISRGWLATTKQREA